jgi:amidase
LILKRGFIQMQDRFGAFVPGTDVVVQPTGPGPLSGLTFAAKDLFDVAGWVTGCGNPDWARTHAPARRHAWTVARLLDAGATLAGKTITDEISLGLLGRNAHYGTPVNPRAPDRFPGGSSSGSAAAVAGGLVDFALGTDSGGSVRVPSSYTGLFGLRPTHGAISVEGLMTQSPSFDTAGFFAANAEIFAKVGAVLLPEAAPAAPITEILFASDAFAVCDPEIREAVAGACAALKDFVGASRDVIVAAEGLPVWNENHVHLQRSEFTRTFRGWVDAYNPRFSYEVGATLALATLVPEASRAAASLFRADVRARTDALLAGGRVLCFPTTPQLPPHRDAPLSVMDAAGNRIVNLTSICGLTGLPQMSLPLGVVDGIPVGLSVVGWRGSDLSLIELARAVGRSPK